MTTADLQSAPSPDYARRLEELGRIILAYSEVTEKLQASHEQLTQTVQSLRTELSEKNRQLERKNRLAALGEMAAGLAHEIRNPLGGIQLYSSLLKKDLVDRPDSARIVDKISGGVRRLESLVSSVLQFTREMTATPVEMDLADAIELAVELATPQLEERCVVCEVIGPRPMAVQADPMLIGQVVLNLILNAAEAIEKTAGGKITVSFGPPPAELDVKQFVLTVKDNGPGIPSQVMDRMFNPFFTTKETGTGLGLAIVHRAIESHDGTIVVTNDEAGGAKFEIRV